MYQDHSRTSRELSNLGNTYEALGDHKKQTGFLARVLEINEKRLGKNHPETTEVLNKIWHACGALGNFEQSMEYLKLACESGGINPSLC